MTVQAYILIQTDAGVSEHVTDELSRIDGILQADDVTGPYEVIVRAEAADLNELGKLVTFKVQKVKGITRTVTCPVLDL